jgi:hypothetical protein
MLRISSAGRRGLRAGEAELPSRNRLTWRCPGGIRKIPNTRGRVAAMSTAAPMVDMIEVKTRIRSAVEFGYTAQGEEGKLQVRVVSHLGGDDAGEELLEGQEGGVPEVEGTERA